MDYKEYFKNSLNLKFVDDNVVFKVDSQGGYTYMNVDEFEGREILLPYEQFVDVLIGTKRLDDFVEIPEIQENQENQVD